MYHKARIFCHLYFIASKNTTTMIVFVFGVIYNAISCTKNKIQTAASVGHYHLNIRVGVLPSG
jgi:hypothetical protein